MQKEKILQKNGWLIYKPQEHTIFEQLHEILSSEIIAGIEGSAFHALILAADNLKSNIKIFSRGNDIHKNYLLISKIKKLNQMEYYPKQIRVDECNAWHLHQYSVDVKEVLLLLGCVIEDDNINHNSLINYIQNKQKSKLIDTNATDTLVKSVKLFKNIDIDNTYEVIKIAIKLRPQSINIFRGVEEYQEIMKYKTNNTLIGRFVIRLRLMVLKLFSDRYIIKDKNE